MGEGIRGRPMKRLLDVMEVGNSGNKELEKEGHGWWQVIIRRSH